MGLGGISVWQLLIVLAIVVLLFGTKRLRTLGSDLGGAIKGFRASMNTDPDESPTDKEQANTAQKTAGTDDAGKKS
jgi:sec-independent protein translocase protein TatA